MKKSGFIKEAFYTTALATLAILSINHEAHTRNVLFVQGAVAIEKCVAIYSDATVTRNNVICQSASSPPPPPPPPGS